MALQMVGVSYCARSVRSIGMNRHSILLRIPNWLRLCYFRGAAFPGGDARIPAGMSSSILRQPGTFQQRPGIGLPPHKLAVQLGGVFAVAFGENLAAELAANFAAEDSSVAKTGEGVGIQHLGPLVGIVSGAVAHR